MEVPKQRSTGDNEGGGISVWGTYPHNPASARTLLLMNPRPSLPVVFKGGKLLKVGCCAGPAIVKSAPLPYDPPSVPPSQHRAGPSPGHHPDTTIATLLGGVCPARLPLGSWVCEAPLPGFPGEAIRGPMISGPGRLAQSPKPQGYPALSPALLCFGTSTSLCPSSSSSSSGRAAAPLPDAPLHAPHFFAVHRTSIPPPICLRRRLPASLFRCRSRVGLCHCPRARAAARGCGGRGLALCCGRCAPKPQPTPSFPAATQSTFEAQGPDPSSSTGWGALCAAVLLVWQAPSAFASPPPPTADNHEGRALRFEQLGRKSARNPRNFPPSPNIPCTMPGHTSEEAAEHAAAARSQRRTVHSTPPDWGTRGRPFTRRRAPALEGDTAHHGSAGTEVT